MFSRNNSLIMSGDVKRYLITGGVGFIGRLVVRELLRDSKAAVAVVDNLSAGLPALAPSARVAMTVADIRDRANLRDVFAAFAPDVVLHLAAIHHIPTCETERAYALDVNIIGTENVLDAAEQCGVERFILASSGAVYDWMEGPLCEDITPLRPRDNYALAKFANEQQLRFCHERTGRDAIVARIFNVVGPGDPNAHLVPQILSQLAPGSRRTTIQLGNVMPRRDYIHVSDVARALAALATGNIGPGIEAYNISTGRETSVGDLVRMIGEILGATIDIRRDVARARRSDRPSQQGAVDKIRDAVGFEPTFDLRGMLTDVIEGRFRRFPRQ